MSDLELKPCPNRECPNNENLYLGWDPTGLADGPLWRAECLECGTAGPEVDSADCDDAQAEAARLWNDALPRWSDVESVRRYSFGAGYEAGFDEGAGTVNPIEDEQGAWEAWNDA